MVNTNGSFSKGTVTTSGTSLSVPTNAVGFILMADDQNTANVRWGAGSTSIGTAVGAQLQPGRDTEYLMMSKAIQLCAESGTQTYRIQWVLSS